MKLLLLLMTGCVTSLCKHESRDQTVNIQHKTTNIHNSTGTLQDQFPKLSEMFAPSHIDGKSSPENSTKTLEKRMISEGNTQDLLTLVKNRLNKNKMSEIFTKQFEDRLLCDTVQRDIDERNDQFHNDVNNPVLKDVFANANMLNIIKSKLYVNTDTPQNKHIFRPYHENIRKRWIRRRPVPSQIFQNKLDDLKVLNNNIDYKDDFTKENGRKYQILKRNEEDKHDELLTGHELIENIEDSKIIDLNNKFDSLSPEKYSPIKIITSLPKYCKNQLALLKGKLERTIEVLKDERLKRQKLKEDKEAVEAMFRKNVQQQLEERKNIARKYEDSMLALYKSLEDTGNKWSQTRDLLEKTIFQNKLLKYENEVIKARVAKYLSEIEELRRSKNIALQS